MSGVSSREREKPQSKESYLASFDHEWREIHEGHAPMTGLKKEGAVERKETCEDVMLKNREMGLFLVADGVSTASGWFASRETAKTMLEVLGEALDRGIENNLREALRRGENPLERMTKYVGAQIIAAIEQAHSRIQVLGAHPEFSGSATTLSFAKLVELPDGKGGTVQRLFYANIGDSRMYLQRKNSSLKRLTQDDSLLTRSVQQGDVTPQEAWLIDQTQDAGTLEPRFRVIARRKNIILKSLGREKPTDGLVIQYVDLQPKDRFLIVSDGVSDQLIEKKIESLMNSEVDDDSAEETLQQAAFAMSLDGQDPRSKGDDISALVHTATEHGPDRSYLHQERTLVRPRKKLRADMRRFVDGYEAARTQRIKGEQALNALDPLTPKRERIPLLVEQERMREVETSYAYHLEKAVLDLFELQVPPRFVPGDQVFVWRSDFDPPSLDRKPSTVTAYDSQRKIYTIQSFGAQPQEVPRYGLELVQPGSGVRIGDQLTVNTEQGESERFVVAGEDAQGQVILTKEQKGVVKRMRVSEIEAQDAWHAALDTAHKSFQRMQQASKNYQQARKAQASLREEAEMIRRMEAKQRAIDIAKKQP